MKKAIITTLAIIFVVAIIATVGGSIYMLNYALDNSKREQSPDYEGMKSSYPELRPWLDSLQQHGILRDTIVEMSNGEQSHAIFARSQKAAGRTAVIVHGYKDQAARMLHIAYIYNNVLGYNILLPDLHAHGRSSGDDIQMGWKDRLTVIEWAEKATHIFQNDSTRVAIALHGISMGAATVMNVSGEQTPDYIRCFVEDCGYTSVWDEFSQEIRNQFHCPPFPLMHAASLLCQLTNGWNFREAAPVKQVSKCFKPMLFIHGDADTFVPTWMVYPCYEAKPQPKQLWIAHGSKHAEAYRDHKKEYTAHVKSFVEKWMK